MVLQRSHLPTARRVWLDFFQQAEALEIFDHAAAGFEAVEAGVGAGCRRSCGRFHR